MSRGVSKESNAAAERFIKDIRDGLLKTTPYPEQTSGRVDFDEFRDLISFRDFLDSQIGRITLNELA